jgi:uncharacterized spore protein YtfJ
MAEKKDIEKLVFQYNALKFFKYAYEPFCQEVESNLAWFDDRKDYTSVPKGIDITESIFIVTSILEKISAPTEQEKKQMSTSEQGFINKLFDLKKRAIGNDADSWRVKAQKLASNAANHNKRLLELNSIVEHHMDDLQSMISKIGFKIKSLDKDFELDGASTYQTLFENVIGVKKVHISQCGRG